MVIGVNLIALYDEQGDGSFRYIHMLLKEMVNYNLSSTKFIIYKQVCISEKYLDLPSNLNVEYINVPNVGRGLKRILFEQTLFYSYLKPCDVLYSYCLSMPLLVRCKKIFTLHDLYSYLDKERYSFLRKIYIQGMIKLYVRAANKIITVSENSKKDIENYLNVPSNNIFITYNFVKPILNIEQQTVFDDANKVIDVNDPFFLYIGSLHNGKNIERMCKAYNEYRKKGGAKRMLMIGKIMENEESYKDLIYNTPGILYLGYQPRKTVEYLLSVCYSVVLVSLYEGFGIPPLEGFIFSKPALVSSTASLPEVVGNAGTYADPYNIKEISEAFFKIEENYSEYQSHTKEQLVKFSPKTSVEQFMRVLGINY